MYVRMNKRLFVVKKNGCAISAYNMAYMCTECESTLFWIHAPREYEDFSLLVDAVPNELVFKTEADINSSCIFVVAASRTLLCCTATTCKQEPHREIVLDNKRRYYAMTITHIV